MKSAKNFFAAVLLLAVAVFGFVILSAIGSILYIVGGIILTGVLIFAVITGRIG